VRYASAVKAEAMAGEASPSMAAKSAVPTIYAQRQFVAAGGLISYGVSLADGYRQVEANLGGLSLPYLQH
jgi:hypothetical protein